MMKTKGLPAVIFALIEKMKSDGYSQARIKDTTSPFQTILRCPLLILFEFHDFGSYKKTHQRGSTTQIPLIYEAVYVSTLTTSTVCPSGRKRGSARSGHLQSTLHILKEPASQSFPSLNTTRSINTLPR